MQTLKKLYRDGLIAYPRVENGYIKNGLYSYFPHPPLAEVNSFLTPLKHEEYEYNEDSLLLHLHNLRYINLSQIEMTKKRIKNTDKKLDKERIVVDVYREFVENKSYSRLDYFLFQQREHYSKKKPKMKQINYQSNNFLDDILSLHEHIEVDFEYDMGIDENCETSQDCKEDVVL